ncbi:hypothetical protein Dimus_039103 [Dionaea muscipula]
MSSQAKQKCIHMKIHEYELTKEQDAGSLTFHQAFRIYADPRHKHLRFSSQNNKDPKHPEAYQTQESSFLQINLISQYTLQQKGSPSQHREEPNRHKIPSADRSFD